MMSMKEEIQNLSEVWPSPRNRIQAFFFPVQHLFWWILAWLQNFVHIVCWKIAQHKYFYEIRFCRNFWCFYNLAKLLTSIPGAEFVFGKLLYLCIFFCMSGKCWGTFESTLGNCIQLLHCIVVSALLKKIARIRVWNAVFVNLCVCSVINSRTHF